MMIFLQELERIATDLEIIPVAKGDETYKSKVSTQKGLSTVL